MQPKVWLVFLSVATLSLVSCASSTQTVATPAKMSDSELEKAVSAKIASDPKLAPYKIDVSANADKNEVSLSGKVPTESLRTLAVDLTKTAAPSLAVTDKIDVKPLEVERKDYTEDMAREAREKAKKAGESVGDTLEDAWIHTKIRGKLLAEGEIPGGNLNVDVKDNAVTLRGSVKTKADKAKAEEIAKNTDGVKSVRNRLAVTP